MALSSGTRLGAYEIRASLGAGGMGEVYLAHDTKLGRDVALKILPDLFASDPERHARFVREARVLASLNHPHIASIYGIEDSSSVSALVLEFVDGPTLADRILEGPLPLEETLRIARQMADALEGAHAQGIIHRDLKPANVKVRSDGAVKVLDFGLAKALTDEASAANPAMSPTITSATQPGVILGTVAYMAPEQARGRAVDKRADVWAFGCVVYEMLTGQRPFPGDDLTDVLAKVIEREPNWSALPAATPAWLRKLLARCLEKDPKRRLRDIGDALLEIETAGSEPASAIQTPTPAPHATVRWSRTLVAGAFALGAMLSGLAVWAVMRADPPTPGPVRRFQLRADDRRLTDVQVISPDGSKIAYTAGGRLWVRDLSETTARDVLNATGADQPFWSRAGERLGYRMGQALWTIRSQGGDPTKLCDLPTAQFRGATWGEQEIVIAVATGWTTGELLRVPTSGGTPETFVAPDRVKSELRLSSPSFLPDGRGLLYAVLRDDGTGEVMLRRDDTVAALVRSRGEIFGVAYSPAGHILFVEAAASGPELWSVAWNHDGTRAPGEPVRVASNASAPSAAGDGTLVFGALTPRPQSLALVDRSGKLVRDLGPTSENARPAVSPDGTRVAHGKNERGNLDLWVGEISGRGALQRLTVDPADEHSPAWLPSGDRVAYIRAAGLSDILIARTDGGGPPEAVVSGPLGEWAPDVSPDGRYLFYYVVAPKTGRDLWYVPLSENAQPVAFLQTAFEEVLATVSPGGDLVAYQSNESGEWEIYVKRFPSGEGRWQLSAGGGRFPRWHPRGGALFYLAGNRLMLVDVKSGRRVVASEPRVLFNGDSLGTVLNPARDMLQRRYDVMPDGEHFVVVIGAEYGSSEITVLENWAPVAR